MPPKPKKTKEEVVSAAVEIIREGGLPALTARSIGKVLCTAPSSVFTHFNSMEELESAATDAVREIYNGYIQDGLSMTPPFKGFGMALLRFSANEPYFFNLLFMKRKNFSNINDFIQNEGHRQIILEAISETFGVSIDNAQRLCENLWLYTYGMATMTATGVCSFTEEETSERLSIACRSFLFALNLPRDERTKIIPEKDQQIIQKSESYIKL